MAVLFAKVTVPDEFEPLLAYNISGQGRENSYYRHISTQSLNSLL
jgi:hypothetical protein